MSRDLAGRKILVSGGSSGLGAAIAVACAQDGAAVAAIGRDKAKLDELAAATGVTPIVADVGDPAAARAAVESAATALGGLDGLVINAGLMLHSLIGDGLDEDWDAIVRVNILGMLHITSAAIPHLRAADACRPLRDRLARIRSRCRPGLLGLRRDEGGAAAADGGPAPRVGGG